MNTPKDPHNGPADDDDRELEEDHREWEKEFEAKKQKILNAPGVRMNLVELERAGANQDKILSGLAASVYEDRETIRALLEKKQRQLRSLADELERISDEIEATFSEPFNYSGSFKAILTPYWIDQFMGKEQLEKVSNGSKQRIKPILNLLQTEAKALGRLRRNLGRIRTVTFTGRLVEYVKESTGLFRDEEMANLLQSAHDALGVEATFSAESLRVMRRRMLPHLLKKRARVGLSKLLFDLLSVESPDGLAVIDVP